MRFLFSMVCMLVFTVQTFSQELKNFQWFDANGKKTTTEKLIKEALKTEVVLFGEYHNNPICHWLQLKLTQSLLAKAPLVLGAEMLEADNQKVLNDYLNGTITQKGLDTLARLWSNYKTDYKPLVDFAKEKQLPFVATNIPRRYASMVFKNDFASLDALTIEEKSWIAPLPIPFDIQLPGYQNMLQMMGGHAGEKMPKAQAIKDATMAHFILQNLQAKGVFLHFNGTYHSDNYEGISWYLQQYRKGTKILTIATVEQSQLNQLEKEHLKKADYILVIDQDMTKTY
ncbi:MAG: ChaN family lipoprotein [Flavobacteriales bacterium]|nr:ChaN family lipoprotein [Flavobacteriales bacterium]